MLSQNSVERGSVLSGVATSDLLEEGEDDSRVHGLVSNTQVDSIGVGDVVDGVSNQRCSERCQFGSEGREGGAECCMKTAGLKKAPSKMKLASSGIQ